VQPVAPPPLLNASVEIAFTLLLEDWSGSALVAAGRAGNATACWMAIRERLLLRRPDAAPYLDASIPPHIAVPSLLNTSTLGGPFALVWEKLGAMNRTDVGLWAFGMYPPFGTEAPMALVAGGKSLMGLIALPIVTLLLLLLLLLARRRRKPKKDTKQAKPRPPSSQQDEQEAEPEEVDAVTIIEESPLQILGSLPPAALHADPVESRPSSVASVPRPLSKAAEVVEIVELMATPMPSRRSYIESVASVSAAPLVCREVYKPEPPLTRISLAAPPPPPPPPPPPQVAPPAPSFFEDIREQTGGGSVMMDHPLRPERKGHGARLSHPPKARSFGLAVGEGLIPKRVLDKQTVSLRKINVHGGGLGLLQSLLGGHSEQGANGAQTDTSPAAETRPADAPLANYKPQFTEVVQQRTVLEETARMARLKAKQRGGA
jgi:hypothetical protein